MAAELLTFWEGFREILSGERLVADLHVVSRHETSET